MPRHISDEDRRFFSDARSRVDEAFDRVIGTPDRVAVLHYPYDGNVGNHMMFSAIAEYLHERKIPLAYVSHSDNFDVEALRAAVGSSPILFLGGVTMSRLWPVHAATKRVVARAFPDNPLLSLTSTMFFVDDEDAADASDMFADHREVVLMAREAESAAQADRVFGDAVNVVIEHDSSLRLGPLDITIEAEHDILWLHRNDLEGVGRSHPSDVEVFDWPAVWDPMYRAPYIRLRACGAISRIRQAAAQRTPASVNRIMSHQYRIASRKMVDCGAARLATGRVLVTDRMHPHVLSAMIGQPVVLLPDRYGKNRSIYEHTTRALSTVHWADTPDEGYELARSLVTASVT